MMARTLSSTRNAFGRTTSLGLARSAKRRPRRANPGRSPGRAARGSGIDGAGARRRQDVDEERPPAEQDVPGNAGEVGGAWSNAGPVPRDHDACRDAHRDCTTVGAAGSSTTGAGRPRVRSLRSAPSRSANGQLQVGFAQQPRDGHQQLAAGPARGDQRHDLGDPRAEEVEVDTGVHLEEDEHDVDLVPDGAQVAELTPGRPARAAVVATGTGHEGGVTLRPEDARFPRAVRVAVRPAGGAIAARGPAALRSTRRTRTPRSARRSPRVETTTAVVSARSMAATPSVVGPGTRRLVMTWWVLGWPRRRAGAPSRGARANSRPWTRASRFRWRRRSVHRTGCPWRSRAIRDVTAAPARRERRRRTGPTPTRTGAPSADATSRRRRSRSETSVRKRIVPIVRTAPRMAPETVKRTSCRREPDALATGSSMTWVAADGRIGLEAGVLDRPLQIGDLGVRGWPGAVTTSLSRTWSSGFSAEIRVVLPGEVLDLGLQRRRPASRTPRPGRPEIDRSCSAAEIQEVVDERAGARDRRRFARTVDGPP